MARTRKPKIRRTHRPAASRRETSETVLFTGFPGFIGARLIPRLLELEPAARFVCLVQEKFAGAATEAIGEMAATHPFTEGRLELVIGDITQPGLGLGEREARRLQNEVTLCHHLAAVYDLAIARDLALRINVEGTRNLLELLGGAKRLKRLDYVSTAFVSGTAVGTYRETDLDVGQKFKNFYEETKFLAELAVVGSGIPAAIYRPGIVVGDSRTGVTAKFDGPYYALAAMSRLPSPGAFIRIGAGSCRVNLVPVDFVLEAIARLSTWGGAVGKTYHLTDPEPMTAIEIAELFARAIGKSFVYLPVPLSLAKLALSAPPVKAFLGMPAQSLDYFDHPVEYDAAVATKDLARFGVPCPRLLDYAQTLVAFWQRKNAEITRGAMI